MPVQQEDVRVQVVTLRFMMCVFVSFVGVVETSRISSRALYVAKNTGASLLYCLDIGNPPVFDWIQENRTEQECRP